MSVHGLAGAAAASATYKARRKINKIPDGPSCRARVFRRSGMVGQASSANEIADLTTLKRSLRVLRVARLCDGGCLRRLRGDVVLNEPVTQQFECAVRIVRVL